MTSSMTLTYFRELEKFQLPAGMLYDVINDLDLDLLEGLEKISTSSLHCIRSSTQDTEKSPANSFSEGAFSRQRHRERGSLRVPRWPLIFFFSFFCHYNITYNVPASRLLPLDLLLT